MNTKQILFDALKSQLDLTKNKCDKYNEEIYNPAFIELKDKVKKWFDENITSTYKQLDYDGFELVVSTKDDNWGSKIRIKLKDYRDDRVNIHFHSTSIDTSNEEEMSYAYLISKVLGEAKNIESVSVNEWTPVFLELSEAQKTFWNDYHNLKHALNNLKNEINSDLLNSMRQIGFELKQFKPRYSFDWDYDASTGKRVYKELISPRSILIRYGRSEHESTYISGFKVLDKKGNKYNIEVFKDNQPNRFYNVLEKKFDKFINEVNEWETVEADRNEKETKKRLAKEGI